MSPSGEYDIRGRLKDLADQAPGFAGLPAAAPSPTSRRRSRAVWAISAAAVVAALVIVPTVAMLGGLGGTDEPVPSVAESPGEDPATDGSASLSSGPPSTEEVRLTGQRLDRGGEPGFGKVVLDLSAGQVIVYWRGDPPEDIAEQSGTRPNGVTVILRNADYSSIELEQAAERVFTDGNASGGLPVVNVRFAQDLSGLLVGYATENIPPDEEAEALIGHLEEVTKGIPVEIVSEAPDVGLVPET